MLCVCCRSRGDCPTSAYTKQRVFSRATTYTQREFVIDCILTFQIYVFQLCFVCFMCCAVHGVIASRRFIQNNKCLIGQPHIHRDSLPLLILSCFNCRRSMLLDVIYSRLKSVPASELPPCEYVLLSHVDNISRFQVPGLSNLRIYIRRISTIVSCRRFFSQGGIYPS